MSLEAFKSDFLTEVTSRLDGFDFDEAADSDLLAKGALYKMTASLSESNAANLVDLSQLVLMDSTALTTWLADTINQDVFDRVLASPTAMNTISGTAFLAVIMGNATAMERIIKNPDALKNLQKSATIWTAFTSGTGLTATSNPNMTSDTTPSGVVSGSIYNTGCEFWKAFANSSFWQTPNATNYKKHEWLAYSFSTPVFIHTFKMKANGSGAPNNFIIEFSDDNELWFTALETSHQDIPSFISYPIVAPGRHQYWRMYFKDNLEPDIASYLGVTEIKLLGFV